MQRNFPWGISAGSVAEDVETHLAPSVFVKIGTSVVITIYEIGVLVLSFLLVLLGILGVIEAPKLRILRYVLAILQIASPIVDQSLRLRGSGSSCHLVNTISGWPKGTPKVRFREGSLVRYERCMEVRFSSVLRGARQYETDTRM